MAAAPRRGWKRSCLCNMREVKRMMLHFLTSMAFTSRRCRHPLSALSTGAVRVSRRVTPTKPSRSKDRVGWTVPTGFYWHGISYDYRNGQSGQYTEETSWTRGSRLERLSFPQYSWQSVAKILEPRSSILSNEAPQGILEVEGSRS